MRRASVAGSRAQDGCQGGGGGMNGATSVKAMKELGLKFKVCCHLV